MKWTKTKPVAVLRRQDPTDIWPRPKRGRKPVPTLEYEADETFHDRYEAAMARTNTSGDSPGRRLRHYSLYQETRAIRNVPGAIAECGCFRGLSATLIAATLVAMDRTSEFHICDSFAGLSDLGPRDLDGVTVVSPKARPGGFTAPEELVRSNLADFDFIDFHKGWIPEQFGALEDKRFALVHIDVDLYEPTRDAFAFFWPRMSPGGVVAFDDYGSKRFPGAKAAVDEIVATLGDCFFTAMPSGHAAAIKIGS